MFIRAPVRLDSIKTKIKKIFKSSKSESEKSANGMQKKKRKKRKKVVCSDLKCQGT